MVDYINEFNKGKARKPSLNIDELIENTERKQLEKYDTLTLWTKTTEGWTLFAMPMIF